jgi:hypothetical protein
MEVAVIRHGRSVVDREGVGHLHGLPWHTARRRKPWSQPGHPRPINEPSDDRRLGGDLRRGGDPALWDTEQVKAYAAGRSVPEIDSANHPDDLLDAREVAALHGLTARQFHFVRNDNRVSLTIPAPDATPYGVAHWRRATAEAMQLRAPRAESGEPSTSSDARRYGRRAEQRARLVAEAAIMAAPGNPINISELARRADVSRITARRFLHEHSTELPTQP